MIKFVISTKIDYLFTNVNASEAPYVKNLTCENETFLELLLIHDYL